MDAVQSRFSSSPAGEVRVPYVRRYTSENNLNQLHVLSKPAMLQKSQRHSLLQSTATSTDDLRQRAAVKNSSSQTNLSSSMGISASLIDLSTINQVSARPLFRFVPPSTNIVKPTVITPTAIPSFPSSAPIGRFVENGFHHENGISAFKPLVSTRTHLPPPPPPPAVVKTEFLYPPAAVHVGLTNQSSARGPLLRQSQIAKPYYHQSMFELPSSGTPAAAVVPNGVHSHVSRLSVQSNSNHPHYIRQPNHPPRPTRYYPPSSRSPPSLLTEPVTKWIQQMKSSTSMHPSVNRPYDYVSPSYSSQSLSPRFSSLARHSAFSPFIATNGFDRSHLRPSYIAPSTAGNIYHFDAKSSHQVRQSLPPDPSLLLCD